MASAKAPASGPTLKTTLTVVQNALLEKDLNTLLHHVALESIVAAKIKKYSRLAKKDTSFTGKVVGSTMSMGEPVLTRLATNFIFKEYAKSPYSMRQYYYKALKIGNIKEKGSRALVSATFMGSPGSLYCINKNNTWIIVNIESPVIDHEFLNLLKIITRKQ